MISTSRRGFFVGTIGGLLLVANRAWAKLAPALRHDDLERIDAGPGEIIRLLDGSKHGYESLSLILSESAPGGGPPLHTHDCEEVHLVESGKVSYVVGDERMILGGPFVLRIPAKVPHAFVNAGNTSLRITAVFGSPNYTFNFIGPNPLWADRGAKAKP